MSCRDLTIKLVKRPDQAWLKQFFERIKVNSLVSLTIKCGAFYGIDSKGAEIDEEVFSTICNWIKHDAHSLRRLTISGIAYKYRMLAFLKSALIARKSQIDNLEVIKNNEFVAPDIKENVAKKEVK